MALSSNSLLWLVIMEVCNICLLLHGIVIFIIIFLLDLGLWVRSPERAVWLRFALRAWKDHHQYRLCRCRHHHHHRWCHHLCHHHDFCHHYAKSNYRLIMVRFGHQQIPTIEKYNDWLSSSNAWGLYLKAHSREKSNKGIHRSFATFLRPIKLSLCKLSQTY